MHRRRANGPMWVSHNKVLVGNGGLGIKKAHARNPNFDSDETKLLIQLWGDPQVQRTLITIHKKHPVIAKIAEKMRGYGYNRSTEEVNTRIKNLKCLYNRIKKDLEAGLLNEPSWKHFQAMDEILSRPVFGNSDKVTSNGNKIVISSLSSSTSSSPPLGLHLCQVKDEDTSGDDADDDMDTMMEYDGNELRPEDLLNVIEDDDEEDDDIIECHQVKEEPVDITDDVRDEDIEEVLEEYIESSKHELSQTEIDDNDLKPPSIKVCKTDTKLKLTTLATPVSIPATVNDSKISIVSNGDTTANKISLVPTKLLLKTQPQTNGTNLLKATPTLVYTSQATVASTVTTPTVSSQKSPAIPMKVLFVNALKNTTTPAQNQAQLTASLNKSLTQLHQQQQQQSKHKIITTTNKQHVVQQISNTKTTPSVQTTTLLQNCRKLLNIMPTISGKATNGDGNTAKTDVENPSASIPARIVHYEPKNPSKILLFLTFCTL